MSSYFYRSTRSGCNGKKRKDKSRVGFSRGIEEFPRSGDSRLWRNAVQQSTSDRAPRTRNRAIGGELTRASWRLLTVNYVPFGAGRPIFRLVIHLPARSLSLRVRRGATHKRTPAGGTSSPLC